MGNGRTKAMVILLCSTFVINAGIHGPGPLLALAIDLRDRGEDQGERELAGGYRSV